MSFSILWSIESKITINEITAHLEKEWNAEIVNNFLDRVYEVIETISKNPLLYPCMDNEKNIHRCIVVTQVSLYYRIRKSEIDLMVFWDNRQDPSLLNF